LYSAHVFSLSSCRTVFFLRHRHTVICEFRMPSPFRAAPFCLGVPKCTPTVPQICEVPAPSNARSAVSSSAVPEALRVDTGSGDRTRRANPLPRRAFAVRPREALRPTRSLRVVCSKFAPYHISSFLRRRSSLVSSVLMAHLSLSRSARCAKTIPYVHHLF